jgi:uncharacterized membrane protein
MSRTGPASHIAARIVQALPAAAVTAITMTLLDLLWLGVVARGFYDDALGPLRRPTVLWPAAALFYLFYVTAIVRLAVLPSECVPQAARRGAALGFVAYATYELTNWAVLVGWPARLVPVDIAWGVVLTSLAAAAGRCTRRPAA